MKRLTSKAGVVLLAVLGAGLVIISGRQVWLTGTVEDSVLGASRVEALGTDAAPGAVALALAALAAAAATATSGRVLRWVTAILLAASTLGLGVVVMRALLDADAILGREAAESTGRTGVLETDASATAWPWVALAGVAVLVITTAAIAFGARRWAGLSERYEVPSGTGSRGERVGSEWERLSAGDDPTDDPTDDPDIDPDLEAHSDPDTRPRG